jgi:hypothetical protein
LQFQGLFLFLASLFTAFLFGSSDAFGLIALVGTADLGLLLCDFFIQSLQF